MHPLVQFENTTALRGSPEGGFWVALGLPRLSTEVVGSGNWGMAIATIIAGLCEEVPNQ